METSDWLILVGAGSVAAALALLSYIVGSWRAEHRAARQYVDGLAQQREYLAEQRAALDAQRLELAEQRAHLAERRRTMPTSGRAAAVHRDEQPTVRLPRAPGLWRDMPDHLNRRGHRRYEEEN